MVEQTTPLIPFDLSELPSPRMPSQEEIEQLCPDPFNRRNAHGKWPTQWQWGDRYSDPYTIRERAHDAIETLFLYHYAEPQRGFERLLYSAFGLVRQVTLDRVHFATRRSRGVQEDAFNEGIAAVANSLRDPKQLDTLADAMGLCVEDYDLPNGDVDSIIRGDADVFADHVCRVARNRIDQHLFHRGLLTNKPKKTINPVQEPENGKPWLNMTPDRHSDRRRCSKRWRRRPYYSPPPVNARDVDSIDADLDNIDKTIVAMSVMGYKNVEIAARLGCSPSTVGRRISRLKSQK